MSYYSIIVVPSNLKGTHINSINNMMKCKQNIGDILYYQNSYFSMQLNVKVKLRLIMNKELIFRSVFILENTNIAN